MTFSDRKLVRCPKCNNVALCSLFNAQNSGRTRTGPKFRNFLFQCLNAKTHTGTRLDTVHVPGVVFRMGGEGWSAKTVPFQDNLLLFSIRQVGGANIHIIQLPVSEIVKETLGWGARKVCFLSLSEALFTVPTNRVRLCKEGVRFFFCLP